MGPPWSRAPLDKAIKNEPHASACTLETVRFIWGEIQRRVQDFFRILFPATDVLGVFRENLKLSHISLVYQAHLRTRLIVDLSTQTGRVTPSFNGTTDREIAPESMQFGYTLPCILQVIWEADLTEGLVRVSKLDVTDAYHSSTL